MGRSKSKRNSLTSTDGSKSGTPRKSLDGTLNGSLKGALKRPLPSDSDSEEEDLEQSFVNTLENGLPKSKKGKFTPEIDETNLGSADEDDITEESESDDAELDESEDDSDDDEEQDDDDEEDEDDEVDDNDASSAEEIKLTKSPIKSDKPKKPVSAKVAKSSEASYVIVPNGPKDLNKLRKLFNDLGHEVSDVQPLRVPLTLVTLSSPESADSLISLQKPLSVDGTTVNLIKLDGLKSVSSLLQGNATNSVFVVNIPKSITMELLKSKLPANCTPTSCKLMQTGPRNKFTNAAYFNFSNVESATIALKALSQVSFDGQSLRVSYGREMLGEHPSNQLRGSTKCLMACQLPLNITEAQLKSIFSTAVSFKLTTRNNESVCFIQFPSEASATEAFDAHNNSHLGNSKLILRFAPNRDQSASKYAAEVHGAPANATVAQVLAAFPGATNAYHNPQGYFTVQFSSLETRKTGVVGPKAVRNCPVKVYVIGGLNDNIAFVKNLPFDASADELRSAYPTASKVDIHMKANGLSTGTATLEFPNADECSKAIAESRQIKGRQLFASLKRVDLNLTEKSKAKVKLSNIKSTPAKPAQPPQVGSASEEESDEEDDDDDESDVSDEDVTMGSPNVKTQHSKQKMQKKQDSDDDDDDSENDGEMDEDQTDDDEDATENDEDSEDEANSDDDAASSGDDMDEEVSHVPKKQQVVNQNFKKDFHKDGKNRGSGHGGNKRGGSEGFNRSRGGGEGFSRGRGGGEGFNRGRGGGDGFNRGRGGGDGFRGGRGGFNKRGGGFNRGRGGRGRGDFKNRGGRGKKF